MTRFISVISGKGGVGKTTTAVNLALSLSLKKQKTLLIDANFNNPNVALHLGMPKPSLGLHDVLRRGKPLEHAFVHHKSGLTIVFTSLALKNANTLTHLHVKKLYRMLGSTWDFVIIDAPPGLSRDVELAMYHGDQAIVVTNPQLPALADAIKAMKVCEDHHNSLLGVVVNRYVGDKYEYSLQEITYLLDRPVLATIPEDDAVRRASKQNHGVVLKYPYAPSSRAFKRLADELMGAPPKGFFDRLFSS